MSRADHIDEVIAQYNSSLTIPPIEEYRPIREIILDEEDTLPLSIEIKLWPDLSQKLD